MRYGDRAFFRDTFGFRSVDAGGGWPIFALPPSELAVHPGEGNLVQMHANQELAGAVLYLMCEDVHAAVKLLAARNVCCDEMGKAEWGLYTGLPLPSGIKIGLYQPTHPTAI